MSRHVYRPNPRVFKDREQENAILSVFSELRYRADRDRREGNIPLARSVARDARNLITLCARRWDGKRMRRTVEVS